MVFDSLLFIAKYSSKKNSQFVASKEILKKCKPQLSFVANTYFGKLFKKKNILLKINLPHLNLYA